MNLTGTPATPQPDDTFTCCETPLPWPTRTEDRTCPECGTVWEHDGIDIAPGARIKPTTAEAARMQILGAMDEDDMRTSLAWLAENAPGMFDAALVRDRRPVEQLHNELTGKAPDDLDPCCAECGQAIGIFIGHGDVWLHYRAAGNPVMRFRIASTPRGVPDGCLRRVEGQRTQDQLVSALTRVLETVPPRPLRDLLVAATT